MNSGPISPSWAGSSAPSATPLEFWVAVAPGSYLQLDDVVVLERRCPTASPCASPGSVAQVRARHEGARFDSDVFLIADGVLPAEVSEAAQVLATRFEPEVFVPPLPGERGAQGEGAERDEALFFDQMGNRAARRPVARRRAGLPQPRVPRRHPRRPRQHQRHLGRGHQDQLRHVPALQPVPLGRARRRGGQHQGADLQREGRGPAVPRPPQHALDRRPARPLRPARPAAGAVRRRWRLRPARRGDPNAGPDVAARPARRHSFFWTIEEFCATGCCRSCSPTPRTTASSTRWSSTTSRPG